MDRRRLAVRALLAAGLLGFLAQASVRVSAAPPADDEIEKAEDEQNRALSEAKRAGSTARVVVTYQSRYGRQETPLNRYLYGRALWYHEDHPGALREMGGIVQAEPGFWQAQVRLAFLHLETKNPTLARKHLEAARALRPEHTDVLRMSAQIGLATKDWDLAIGSLRRLLQKTPNREFSMALLEALRGKGDWPAVYVEARALRLQGEKNRFVRILYSAAALQTGKLDEAAQEYEALAQDDPQGGPTYLAPLQQIYAQQKNWKALLSVLLRMRPFVKPERLAELDQVIEALKAGKVPGAVPEAAPAPPAPPTEEEYTLALLERCLSPEVVTRRAALREFFEAGPIGIPKAIQVRYHPAEEPDPECRAWVLKLIGALRDDPSNPSGVQRALFAKIPGHALQDKESSLVRRVAAEVLGEIGTPAGVLYLMPNMGDFVLTATASEDVVQEFNAARRAYALITGFDDLEVGASPWVLAPGLEASRKRWDEWFASPAGVVFLKKAIDDMVRTGETHPEWYYIYAIYVSRPEVARAAYEALLARSTQPHKDTTAQRLYPTFPQMRTTVDGKALSPEESLADVVKRLKVWWLEWTEVRKGSPK